MKREELHEAAYAVMQPRLDADRREAVERFAALHGSGDARAATSLEDVVRAVYQGRIDMLLLAEGEAVDGRYNEAADEVATGPEFGETGGDLLDAVAVQTLRHGGAVYVLPQEEMPDDAAVAALLRY